MLALARLFRAYLVDDLATTGRGHSCGQGRGGTSPGNESTGQKLAGCGIHVPEVPTENWSLKERVSHDASRRVPESMRCTNAQETRRERSPGVGRLLSLDRGLRRRGWVHRLKP